MHDLYTYDVRNEKKKNKKIKKNMLWNAKICTHMLYDGRWLCITNWPINCRQRNSSGSCCSSSSSATVAKMTATTIKKSK